MNKFIKIILISFFALFLLSGTAMAVPFNTRPVPFNPTPPYPDEDSMQVILNNVLDNNVPDAYNDQRPDAYWTASDTGPQGFSVTLFTSVPGTFGVYSFSTGDEVDLLDVFAPGDPNDGGVGAGSERLQAFFIDGAGNLSLTFGGTIEGTGFQTFGFYWGTSIRSSV